MNRDIMAKLLDMPKNSTDDAILEKLNSTILKGEKIDANLTIDYFIENNPAALKKIMVHDPEKFEKIAAKYFDSGFRSEKFDETLGTGYQDASKKQLLKAKEDLMKLSTEEREEFKESYPEEYKKIMS